MPRKPYPCAICGEPINPGTGTLPAGQASHNRCRSANPDFGRQHGTSARYDRGCRCDECREAKAAYSAEWNAAYMAKHGCHYSSDYRRKQYEQTGVWSHPRGGDFADAKTRLMIYERDNWTCQLCGEPVDPNAEARRDRPSLDHIVPQSHQLVPDHSPDNLRLAHVGCNAKRGDRIEQDVA